MTTMNKSVYEFLGNDIRHVYRVDEHGDRYVCPNEVRNAMENRRREVRNTYFLLHPLLTFSDYHGNAQSRSNVRMFLEKFKNHNHVRIVRQLFGAESIAIDIQCRHLEIIELLQKLARGGTISSDDVAEMESELKEEAWEDHIKGDLTRAIKKKFDIDELGMTDEALKELYIELLERSDIDVIIEDGCLVYVNIEKLIEHLHELPTAA
jgi:hypothetical protein